MAVCPNGHDSASDDFCDVCGMRIDGGQVRPMSPASRGQAAAGEACPRCGTIRIGQFCEACGFNFGSAGYTSARASFSPVASPPRPTFTPAGPDATLDPTPAPAYPQTPEPSPRPSGRHSASRTSYPSGPQSPVAPEYPSGPQSPPAREYPSGPQSPPVREYPSGPQSPPVREYPSGPQSPPARASQPAAAVPPSSAGTFPYSQATWTAAVGADRGYYEQVQEVSGPEGADVTFPPYYTERRFQLLGNQMRIGRRSVSRGLAPEIDLTGPPADPGISRLHAVLIAAPDGGWSVLDPGSANGTLLNGTEIKIGTPVPLHDGDRINLGAWTSITVHRD